MILIEQNRILSALKDEIDNISLNLPDETEISSLSALKPFEDALDALICGWIGIQYLNTKAIAYGDETAAVWIPF
jgi:predicted RNase H-like nuclease